MRGAVQITEGAQRIRYLWNNKRCSLTLKVLKPYEIHKVITITRLASAHSTPDEASLRLSSQLARGKRLRSADGG